MAVVDAVKGHPVVEREEFETAAGRAAPPVDEHGVGQGEAGDAARAVATELHLAPSASAQQPTPGATAAPPVASSATGAMAARAKLLAGAAAVGAVAMAGTGSQDQQKMEAPSVEATKVAENDFPSLSCCPDSRVHHGV